MAEDAGAKEMAANSCCETWKDKYTKLQQKYAKLENGRAALRQGIELYERQISMIQVENQNLKKAYEEAKDQAASDMNEKSRSLATQVALENEISVLKSQISSLSQTGGSQSQISYEEVELLRVRLSEAETEVKRLQKATNDERIKAERAKKNAEVEKKKATKTLKVAEEEKRRAEEEIKSGKEDRLQLERLKVEVNEVKSQLALERSKFDEANKRLEDEKHRVFLDKRRGDLEMAKAKEQRKLAEMNKRKAAEEKCRADCLCEQLEDERQKYEKLKIEMDQILSSKKHADLVLGKEHRMVLEASREKYVDEKFHANALLVQKLEKSRETTEELRKDVQKLLSVRMTSENPVIPLDKSTINGTGKMKLLKKQLKLVKMQAKHAEEVAKLEKCRNNIIERELSQMKMEFTQFSHRFELCGLCQDVGMFHGAKDGKINLKRKCMGPEEHFTCFSGRNELLKPDTVMEASDRFKQSIEWSTPRPVSSDCTESASGERPFC